MSFKITGLDEFQRQLNDAAEALKGLAGEIAAVKFNPNDPSSMEAAVVQMEQAIDTKIAPYRGNKMVENLTAQMKDRYRQEIRAAKARLQGGDNVIVPMPVDPATLRQIENVIFDLQSSDYNNFDKSLKKLARLLHSSELEPITSTLIDGINLDPWIEAGVATGCHMAGTAQLDWPADPEKELGTIILLIDRFANKGARDALVFAHTFYNNGSNINANLHNMTRQMLIPFARDYINYIKSKTGTVEATMLPASTEPAARKVFIVHGHDEGAREMVARYVQKLANET